jgi:hypothetical protein
VLGREAVRWLSLETSRIPLSGDGRARLALLTEPHSAPAQIAGLSGILSPHRILAFE